MKNVLKKLEFSDKEIEIYLAAFQLKSGSFSELSRLSKIKRPTTYLILQKFDRMDLVKIETKNNKKYFTIQPAKQLLELLKDKRLVLKKKEDLVKQSLPLFKSISNKDVSLPDIRYFEGQNGMWNIIDDLILSNSEAWIIAPGKFYDALGTEKILANVIQKRREMNKKAYIIMDHHIENVKLWRLQENNVRECRFVSKEIDLSTTVYMYSNRVALIFWREPYSGLIINNERFFKLSKFMFDALWKQLENKNIPDGIISDRSI